MHKINYSHFFVVAEKIKIMGSERSLIPRPSACVGDPLPNKNKREENSSHLFFRGAGRGEEGLGMRLKMVRANNIMFLGL